MATGMDQTRTPGSRIAGALEPETVAGGILVALEPVEHHNGWQLRQWSWRCMVPVANVQARGEGLLVDTMVSGQGFQAYLSECPTRLWRRGWTKPERQARGSLVHLNQKRWQAASWLPLNQWNTTMGGNFGSGHGDAWCQWPTSRPGERDSWWTRW